MTDFTPHVLGSYRVVERLDERRVLAVPAEGADTLVELRFVDDTGALDADARMLSRFDHRTLLGVRDVARGGGQAFVVMEYVDGADLGTLVRLAAARGEAVPAGFAGWIGMGLCRALHHIHSRTDKDGRPLGAILRDLPLERVQVGVDGRVRLDALGLLVSAERAQLGERPSSRPSPEWARGEPVGRRSDLWRVCRLVVDLIRGESPEAGDGGLPPGIPAAMAEVLTAGLADRPTDRPGTASALGDGLRRAVLADTDARTVRGAVATWVADLASEMLASRRADLADHAEALALEQQRALASREKRVRGVLRASRLGPGLLIVAVGLAVGAGAWWARPPSPVPSLDVRTTGSVVVAVEPAARVLVDGRVQGEGVEIRVDDLTAGRHVLSLSAEGFTPLEAAIQVTAGGVTRVSRALVPAEAVVASILSLDTRPTGAVARVDGVRVGKTPVRYALPDEGRGAVVTFELPGFQPATRRVRGLLAGETRAVEATLTPR